jgi:hypothetical protein
MRSRRRPHRDKRARGAVAKQAKSLIDPLPRCAQKCAVADQDGHAAAVSSDSRRLVVDMEKINS